MFVGNLAKVCVLYTTGFGSECDKYIQIFECIGHEYYSDIRSYRFLDALASLESTVVSE